MKKHLEQEQSTNQGRVARRRAQVRANLLAAAREVFLARGYQDATVSEITQIADVAMGTFYLHFRDKEDLFAALVHEAFDALGERIEAVLADQPHQPVIPIITSIIFRAAYEHRDMVALIYSGAGTYITDPETFDAQEWLIDLVLPTLQEQAKREPLPFTDLSLLAHLIVGLLMQSAMWWIEHDEPGPEEMARHVLSLLGHGLPAALLTSAQSSSSESSM
ncbi:TetR/AcrR family transcriptional regulator [Ktedonosporobacter rubrisoli]|uniref:TetR/AcrR family transcriptional regulator n=1 Tax=Ktedonosporobacter rubrisoli TaxID=2509675 RepID=A0A4P6JIV8_KTERU|nr:TetR/AcrR family transcriptional regulator [Ktedonosporobacter rubrisoli]QBD75025.1 TetR/AcrR family transcriptional regulator [Ktedonosporobacter rubrisoli]